MAALAPLGYEFFCFHNSECSEGAFVRQDTSVQLHKSGYDSETGQYTKAQPIQCANVGVNILLFKGFRGQLEELGRRFCYH